MAKHEKRSLWRVAIKILGALVMGSLLALLGAALGYFIGNTAMVMAAFAAPCFLLGAYWGWRQPGEVVARALTDALGSLN